jgi:O-antigen ligase
LVTITPFFWVASILVRKASISSAILILFSLNLFALILNFSLGAWVALAALCVLIGLNSLPRKVLLLSLALVLIGIFFLFSNSNRSFYHRFTDSSAGLDSYNTRWILAKFSLEKVKENPSRMIGFGQRSFAKQYKEFVESYKDFLMWHAHNTFLNIALQTGLQGLILFCFLLYRLLKYGYENMKLEGESLKKFYFTATFMTVITFLSAIFRTISSTMTLPSFFGSW